mgnify:CR=1 FL=1
MLKRFNQVAELLSLSRNGLHKLMAKDDAFPIPIRMGESRKSHLFFDVNELEKWLENKKAQRFENKNSEEVSA